MNNKYTIITGGANGLGKTISKFLAEKKQNLIIIYNTSLKSAEELKKHLELKYHVKIIIYKCDISNEIEINQFKEFLNK